MFARGRAGNRTTVRDSHDRAASIDDGTTQDDDQGDIVEDPDGGGPVAMDPLHLLAQVNHLVAQDAGKSLEDVADNTPPPPPPPPPPTPPPARQTSDDPEEGGEGVPDFGAGAMPPRPVTMTADDLRSSDPEEGGEIAEDPDAGGEVTMIVDTYVEEEPLVFEVVETFEPEPVEPELTDFEAAADFDQAAHTLAADEV